MDNIMIEDMYDQFQHAWSFSKYFLMIVGCKINDQTFVGFNDINNELYKEYSE